MKKIIILVMLSLSYCGYAADTVSVNACIQRVLRGNKVIGFDAVFQMQPGFYETSDGLVDWDHDYNLSVAYFFANRYSFDLEAGLYVHMKNYSDGSSLAMSDRRLEISTRRYFGRRAGLFIGMGVVGGFVRYSSFDAVDYTQMLGGGWYIRPMLAVGYEYLITDLHPALNNHLALNVSACGLVPCSKSDLKGSKVLTFWPAVTLGIGLRFYL